MKIIPLQAKNLVVWNFLEGRAERYLVPCKEVILNYTELFCKKLLASIVPSKSLDGNFDPQFTHCSISHETPDLEAY